MRTRVVALIVMWVLLAGCGSDAAPCGEDRPEDIVVDGSAFAAEGSELEVCIFDPREGLEYGFCGELGSTEVGLGWGEGDGDYPDAVAYTVTRYTLNGSASDVMASGSYQLQCQAGTVRIELGVRE